MNDILKSKWQFFFKLYGVVEHIQTQDENKLILYSTLRANSYEENIHIPFKSIIKQSQDYQHYEVQYKSEADYKPQS